MHHESGVYSDRSPRSPSDAPALEGTALLKGGADTNP
jgi:hypothetical protein